MCLEVEWWSEYGSCSFDIVGGWGVGRCCVAVVGLVRPCYFAGCSVASSDLSAGGSEVVMMPGKCLLLEIGWVLVWVARCG